MVSLSRYHHQYLPDELQFEKRGLTAEEQQALTARRGVVQARKIQNEPRQYAGNRTGLKIK